MNEPAHDTSDEFGRGVVAHQLQSFDWSRTSLGPVDRWPDRLRSTLALTLASPAPMLVWWGRELLGFHNDASIPLLGDRHPFSLGEPAQRMWSDVWSVLGPVAADLLRGGGGVVLHDVRMLVSNGSDLEETYVTWSFGVVRSERGATEGVLATLQDTTAKVQTERRIRMLHDLAERTSSTSTEEDTVRVALDTLAANALDLPFMLLYIVSADGHRAELAGARGWVDHVEPGVPHQVSLLAHGDAGWPLVEAMRSGREHLVENLSNRFGAPSPLGSTRPEQALILPITLPAEKNPAALLVVGVSPHRALDERYQALFRATAEQLSVALTQARARDAERRLTDGLAELERREAALSTKVSHAFRTPLTLILGMTEDALASPERTLAGEPLESVRRSALRLMKSIDGLLDFSRLEAGRLQGSFEATDLAAVTRAVVATFRPAIEAAGLTLELHCPPLPQPVFVDREMWAKIVLNLLSNALDTTFHGSIGVSTRWCGDHVNLEIRAGGSSLDEAELERVFERFHRPSGIRTRSHASLGIGLALAHDLVRVHDGSIRVGKLGGGTVFTVSVPCGFAHLPPERIGTGPVAMGTSVATAFIEEALSWTRSSQTAEAPDPVNEARPPSNAARILVVEADADLRAYVVSALRRHYVVDCAVDAASAVRLAAAQRPALIVSDSMLPDLDGASLLRALQEDRDLRRIPVLLLATRTEDGLVEALEAGAHGHLFKPFASADLLARVRAHLGLAPPREVLDHFLELSSDLVCVTNSAGQLVRVSASFAGLGWTPGELLDRPFLDLVHPEDVMQVMDCLELLIDGGAALELDTRCRRKDGSHVVVSWSVERDASGRLVAIGREASVAHARRALPT